MDTVVLTPDSPDFSSLVSAFTPADWWAGRRIASAGDDRVRILTQRFESRGGAVFAVVREDESERPFDVSVMIQNGGLNATCGCGGGRQCRHSAAVVAHFCGVDDAPDHPELAVPSEYYADFSAVESEADDEAAIDWLEFKYGVVIEGTRIHLLPFLIEYLEKQRGDDLTAELPSSGHVTIRAGGRTIAFPVDRLRRILDVLTELFDPGSLDEDGHLRLHPLRAEEVEHALRRSHPDTATSRPEPRSPIAESGAEFEELDCPDGFIGELRPYQREGVAWLQHLRASTAGGVLADDMGLGKTVQTLCHLQCEKSSGRADRPSLIIAPKSVIGNWVKEAKKFTPGMRVLHLEGARRHRYYDVLDSCDLLLTTYPVLARDIDRLSRQPFHCAILDEAQMIKNAQARTAEAACRLDARHRICLSGTPMENHLGELWSLFHFLMPGFLGSRESFTTTFRRPIEKEADTGRLQLLQERVSPYLLRRTKDLVATELPPKTEIVRPVELGADQAELYEAVRAGARDEVRAEIAARGIDASRMVILTAILKLRQLCCDPRLLKLDRPAEHCPSAKLEMLTEMLEELTSAGRRIIVFSQFTGMLDLIAGRLERRNIDYLSLTGKSKDRMGLVDKFQSGDVPVFLISLRAGATGLNLTAADTVIHYDPWWNPAVESQATDRAYRIGQKNAVFVYKLVGAGTIEEKILKLQQRKSDLVKTILGQNTGGLDLSQTEIDKLLAPLGE